MPTCEPRHIHQLHVCTLSCGECGGGIARQRTGNTSCSIALGATLRLHKCDCVDPPLVVRPAFPSWGAGNIQSKRGVDTNKGLPTVYDTCMWERPCATSKGGALWPIFSVGGCVAKVRAVRSIIPRQVTQQSTICIRHFCAVAVQVRCVLRECTCAHEAACDL